MTAQTIVNRRTVWWILAIIVLLALAVDAFWLEPSSIHLVDHKIELSSAGELHGLRVAVIADLHAGAPYINEEKVNRIVQLTLAAKPDMILLAGDTSRRAQSEGDIYQSK
jgi:hypothetical protein